MAVEKKYIVVFSSGGWEPIVDNKDSIQREIEEFIDSDGDINSVDVYELASATPLEIIVTKSISIKVR